MKKRGIPAYFGDAADVEFLEQLPLDKAALIVSTIPEPDDQLTFITHARKRNEKAHLIATLYQKRYLDALYAAGCDYVLLPHLVGGQWIAGILKRKPWTKRTFQELQKDQHDDMKMRATGETS
ncbi:MAG: NAD-binding protein [Patescibacteria group bacterium]